MRLHLRRIRVVRMVRDDEAELVVEVADSQSVKRCPACGLRTARVHETRRRRVRDLPSLGRPTTLVVQVRRFECRCGHRFTPEHPELAGKITRSLVAAQRRAERCRVLMVDETSLRRGPARIGPRAKRTAPMQWVGGTPGGTRTHAPGFGGRYSIQLSYGGNLVSF